MTNTIEVPVREVGPIKMLGDFAGSVSVPLATYETPLWPSVSRGAKISRRTAGIMVHVTDDRMTRSIIVEGPDSQSVLAAERDLSNRLDELQSIVGTTSRYAKLIDLHGEVVGNLLYLRLEFTTGDASGHNMTTKAADAILSWIDREYDDLKYVSISGNYCIDKKVSAINPILGRGKRVIADITIPANLCKTSLHTTPHQIADLNAKKNHLGSILAGSLRSANAHYANMLLAIYLATGQDAANIVEGSQGITHVAVDDNGDLYFSVTCPNIIVGTVGNGKHHQFSTDYLEKMGCLASNVSAGENARRLAAIIGATVLCGELSLLAAQTNPGELVRVHEKIERRHDDPNPNASDTDSQTIESLQSPATD